MVTQAGLPGPLGGIGLKLMSSCADAHYVAKATAKLVEEALGTNQEFADEAVVETASDRLTDKGVKVSTDGQITMTDWTEQMVNSGSWRAHHTTNARLP